MEYRNLNICRSFKQSLPSTVLTALSSQTCSEVIFVNRTGVPVEIYDKGYADAANSFLLEDKESDTFRGVTNSDQVSAKAIGGTGNVYYRTQFYSNNTSR